MRSEGEEREIVIFSNFGLQLPLTSQHQCGVKQRNQLKEEEKLIHWLHSSLLSTSAGRLGGWSRDINHGAVRGAQTCPACLLDCNQISDGDLGHCRMESIPSDWWGLNEKSVKIWDKSAPFIIHLFLLLIIFLFLCPVFQSNIFLFFHIVFITFLYNEPGQVSALLSPVKSISDENKF